MAGRGNDYVTAWTLSAWRNRCRRYAKIQYASDIYGRSKVDPRRIIKTHQRSRVGLGTVVYLFSETSLPWCSDLASFACLALRPAVNFFNGFSWVRNAQVRMNWEHRQRKSLSSY